MGLALNRLAQEDPSFRVRTDEESGQTIIAGMGELHLEIIVDRMKREFGVEATVGKPQVAYRETIRKRRRCRRQVRQAVGWSWSVRSRCLTLEPQEPARASSSSTPSRAVCSSRIHPCGGKRRARNPDTGVLAGYPVVDVKVTLTFGSYHDVDSNENAFRMAGSMAFKEACKAPTQSSWSR
jgi:elongation factor G